MAITVRIPSVLRTVTAGQDILAVTATDINSMLQAIDAAHPGIRSRLCDDAGKLRRTLQVFVGEDDIRFLDGQATALKDGDVVDIVPAVAGGTAAARR